MRITIREVAREAGVSVATVSRALNGNGSASEETCRRIRDVAERLRYAPNESARALIRSRTQTLGVLLPELHGEFFSEVIRGIEQRARLAGFHLLVSSFHSDRGEMEATLRAMRGRVDGLILMCPATDARDLLANLAGRLPAVMLNAPRLAGIPCATLSVDNVGGARAMMRHLIRLGHRRIAMIRGAEGNHDALERTRGYRDALRAAARAVDPALERPGDFTEDAGYRATEALLDMRRRPDAIFAANDAMAVGALGALRDAGVRIPDDIALTGFDDIPIARYLTPPLTSVHVAIDDLGRRATDLTLAALDAGARMTTGHHVLRSTLVVRSSCGAGAGRKTRPAARRATLAPLHAHSGVSTPQEARS